MTDPKEPQNETVRITPSAPPVIDAATSGLRKTVRINSPADPLPNGETSPVQTETPLAPVFPVNSGQSASHRLLPPSIAPKPATPVLPPKVPEQIPASLMPAASSLESDDFAATMPLIAPPPNSSTPPQSGPKKETARIVALPYSPLKPPRPVEMKNIQPLILMPWCWALLGASILTLLIQIWNYFA